MQEFKEGKSSWIPLACGEDVEVADEELVVLVNRDQVVQGQDEDVVVAVVTITEVIDLPIETGPIFEQPGAADQGVE